MKTYSRLLLAFLLLILVVPLGCSTNQSDEWEKAYKQSQSLGGDGKYNEAIVSAKKALKLAEKNWPNDSQHSNSLYLLADLYDSQGLYANAEPLFKQCLVIEEKNLGSNHPDVATTVNGLALLYDTQGKYAEAEPLYKRALAILEKAIGPDHPNVAASLNNLAALYRATDRKAEAEKLEKRAAAIEAKPR
jgi:tetratricopeptide (TPR) repeat protein